MMVLNTNLMSLIAQNNLRASQQDMQTAMERLSSGLRINSAKDDPAGQAIANRMESQIRGMNQAMRNTQDGISLAQVAEGSLDQVNENLQRIRQLSVQAANGTNSSSDLRSIQDEIDLRLEEIDRLSSQSNFNGVNLLADDRDVSIQVGANDGDVINIALKKTNIDTLGLGNFSVLDDGSATANPLSTLDDAISQVDRQRSSLGAVQNRFDSVIEGLNSSVINLSSAQSRIQDADYAREVSNLISAQIRQQVGIAILAQANQQPQMILRLLGL
ncbi:flagellin N-terminal helical domain-containing protein [Halomonas sp. LS-001]